MRVYSEPKFWRSETPWADIGSVPMSTAVFCGFACWTFSSLRSGAPLCKKSELVLLWYRLCCLDTTSLSGTFFV